MPRLRRDAVLFANKHGVRAAARHYGFSPGAIVAWKKKAVVIGLHPIPTGSSRPKHHPKELSDELVWKIFHTRMKVKRSAEVVHHILKEEGIETSLSSVKRTLDRSGLLKKRSPWKRFHPHIDRPVPERPGSLVELDTIHTMTGPKSRLYTFTLIDVYSRWTFAKSFAKMNAATSVAFVAEAQRLSGFRFLMTQTDHGPEFGSWFVEQSGIPHRYTRLGKPNDNAHIERFNRTLQEECLDKHARTPEAFNRALKKYIKYYNAERHHFSLKFKTPVAILKECSQAID
jgi:transposase InsO family protein